MAAMDVDMSEEKVERERSARAWTVSSTSGKGFRQQLDSFSEFIHTIRRSMVRGPPRPNSRFWAQRRSRPSAHLAPPHCSNRQDVRFHDRAEGSGRTRIRRGRRSTRSSLSRSTCRSPW